MTHHGPLASAGGTIHVGQYAGGTIAGGGAVTMGGRACAQCREEGEVATASVQHCSES